MNLQTHDHTTRNLKQRLHTAGSANGHPVLLLHGLFDTGASFAPLVDALSRQLETPLRYIAPDWRGHGGSDPAPEGYWFPDYLADLDALLTDVAPDQAVTLVGHSMGGQVASLYAGARPEAVSHLITLDSLNVPDAPVDNTADRYRRWLNGLRQPQKEREFDTIEAVAERITRRYPELSHETRLFLAKNWAGPTNDGQYRLTFDPRHRLPFPNGFRAEEAKALWREVSAPVLCLDAGDSPLVHSLPQETMAERRACFKNMTHETIAGCGHMLHLQAPDRVACTIRRFFDANRGQPASYNRQPGESRP